MNLWSGADVAGMVSLPDDIARCAGVAINHGAEIVWHPDCETCARRLAPPNDPAWVAQTAPPPDLMPHDECDMRVVCHD